jgi:hypothetical protein
MNSSYVKDNDVQSGSATPPSSDVVKAMFRGFLGGVTSSHSSFNLVQVVLICMEDQDPGPPIKRVGKYNGECSEANDHVEQLSRDKRVYYCSRVLLSITYL